MNRENKISDDIVLSGREKEILAGLAGGLTYEKISARLGISINTIRTYLRRIYKKLQVHTRTEAVVVYQRFLSESGNANTLIGLPTIPGQRSAVDRLRTAVLDRGRASGWPAMSIAGIDHRFREVFRRRGPPGTELLAFVTIVLKCLTFPTATNPQHARAVFPSWEAGLLEYEVVKFLDFVHEMDKAHGNVYFREIRQCGKIPFAGCLAYYYRRSLETGRMPSFLNGGTDEDAELQAYLCANYNALFAGGIRRTKAFPERLLREAISLGEITNQLAAFAVGPDLSPSRLIAMLNALYAKTSGQD